MGKQKKWLFVIFITLFLFVMVFLIFKSNEGYNVSFSVVQGQIGVKSIDLTITVVNTGEYDLTCFPFNVKPEPFNSALDQSPKIVPSTGNKKASWTSNRMSVSQFEGLPLLDRFEVKMKCYYTIGNQVHYLDDQTAYIDLDIRSDKRVVFRTNDNTATPPEEYRYSQKGSWIAIDCDGDGFLEGYGYYGDSSYDCVSNILGETYDNYPVCTREDYGCFSRIYIDIGTRGKIYSYDRGTSAILGNNPCCGVTCGSCCERYSDGSYACF